MQNHKLIGTGVALVTPFDDKGQVDTDALASVVNYQVDNNIDYLVVLGTTAENVTLSNKEKKEVVETIVNANAERLPLVLGIGSNDTKSLTDQIKATDLSAFEALLSVTPYYNKPTQEGIYEHFKTISQATEKPIILYNVPGRTATNIDVETVVRLANDFENIIGIKEAAGNIEQAYEMINQTPDDFMVISGDDMLALPMVLGGGSGVISVIAQGFPKVFSEMLGLGLAGKSQDAFFIYHKIAPVIKMIFEQGNPAGIKTVLKHLNLIQNHVRLPLVKASKDLDDRLADFISKFEV